MKKALCSGAVFLAVFFCWSPAETGGMLGVSFAQEQETEVEPGGGGEEPQMRLEFEREERELEPGQPAGDAPGEAVGGVDPVWIGLGALGFLLIVILVVLASRGGGDRTTVVRGPGE